MKISKPPSGAISAGATALVNPVNCVGVSGKGLALEFKRRFPENFEAYRAFCKCNAMFIGDVFIPEKGPGIPRFIVNFPTKQHWKHKSNLNGIALGLCSLRRAICSFAISSIAIPALGCGLGGLAWEDVRRLIAIALDNLPDVEILVYKPEGVA